MTNLTHQRSIEPIRALAVIAAGILVVSGCASLSEAGRRDPDVEVKRETKAKLAEIQALPYDARYRIAVSVRQARQGASATPGTGDHYWDQAWRNGGVPLSGALPTDVSALGPDQLKSAIEMALGETNRFILINRDVMDDFKDEEELDKGGYAKKETKVQRGEMESPELAIDVLINEISSGESRDKGGIHIGPIDIGGKKGEAMVRLSARVTEIKSRRVLWQGQAEGKQERSEAKLGFKFRWFGADVEKAKAPTVALAGEKAIAHLVYKLATQVEPKQASAGVTGHADAKTGAGATAAR